MQRPTVGVQRNHVADVARLRRVGGEIGVVERRIKRCHTGESVQDYDCNDSTIKTCKNSHIWNTQAIEHVCGVASHCVTPGAFFFMLGLQLLSRLWQDSSVARVAEPVGGMLLIDCQHSHATGKGLAKVSNGGGGLTVMSELMAVTVAMSQSQSQSLSHCHTSLDMSLSQLR